jgi:OOP family OmpA-OmpF porin
MKNKLILVGCLMSAGLACADSGFYVGVNLGMANTQSILDASSGTTSHTGLGLGALAGYQFNNYLSAELSYLSLAQYSSSANNSGASVSTTADNSFLTANVKGTLPLPNKFSVFGKFGLGYNFASGSVNGSADGATASVSGNSNNFATLIGIGGAYNVMDNLSIYVANDYYMVSAPTVNSGNTSSNNFGYGNVNYLNLGVEYKF